MKNLRKYLLMLAITVICLTGVSVTANAAAKLVPLKAGTTYRCDVTSDLKVDTLKYTMTRANNVGYMNIYINGKRLLCLDGRGFNGLWYFAINAANEYLIVNQGYLGGGNAYLVYRGTRSGLAYVGQLPNAYKCGRLFVKSDGTIYYATSPKYAFEGCYLGNMMMVTNVKVYNGKMAFVSRYAPVRAGYNTYTATRNFYLTRAAGSNVSNGVLVRSGQKVKFEYGYFYNKQIYFRVRVGNKIGWLPTNARLK